MFKITDDNYQEYEKVFVLIRDFIFGDLSWMPIPDETVGEIKKPSKSQMRSGLKQGLNDLFTMIKLEFPESKKNILNEKLLNEGLPGLWNLMSILNEVPGKVLKRGKIRNLDEWYVIKEFLDDLDSGISNEERDKLEKFSNDFEMKAAKKKG